MEDRKIYSLDYYTFKKVNEERNFINLLNKNEELKKEVVPSIKSLKEQLFLALEKKESFSNFDALLINEEKLNSILAIQLSGNILFSKVEDKSISDNLFSNVFKKLCSRLFHKDGSNNEKYIILSYIHYWLENRLAESISNDNRFSHSSTILKVLSQTEMLHHFYSDLKSKVPKEWIDNEANEWGIVNNDPRNILESIRTFDSDYFKDYEDKLKTLGNKTHWGYISEATRNSEYAMLNDEYSFKSNLLLDKDISNWILFWDKLKIPLLQDVVFHYIDNVDDYLKIAKALINQKSNITNSNPSRLSFIILKNFFESSIKINERLSFYQNNERLNNLSEYEKDNSIITKGKIAYNNWQLKRDGIYVEIVNSLKEVLSVQEIEEWAFSYKPKSSPKNEYTDTYNLELTLIQKAYKSISESLTKADRLKGLEKDFSLQKFNFIISEIKNITNKEAESLLFGLLDFIETKDFYWDKSYSPPYWASIKNIGFLLSLVNNPFAKAFELIDKMKINYEGWNVNTNDYKLINKETFILCGIPMLMEHPSAFKSKEERVTFFKTVLNFVINQTRYSILHSADDYILPLHIFYLVANQIHIDMKYYFEKEIIQNIDDLGCILKILSSENYKLKPNSVKLLQRRIDNEILFEKRKLMRNKSKKEIEVLDNMIKKLELT